METQPEITAIVDNALADAAENYLRYVVFEQQPKSGNILDLPQREELHDIVWNAMRQILLVWFEGDWDAVQRLILYLEDEVGSLETFDRQAFLTRCHCLRPDLPASVELLANSDE